MTEIRLLAPHEVEAVSALARVVWQATYPALISQAQIDFMLADRYRRRAHSRTTRRLPARLVVAQQGQQLAGFAHASLDSADCKLDKLYVHADMQRRESAARCWQRFKLGVRAARPACGCKSIAATRRRLLRIKNGLSHR